MESIRYINISLELMGAIISLIIWLSLSLSDNVKSKTDRLFIWILLFNIMTLVSDAIAWGEKGGVGIVSTLCVYIANFMVYISGYLLLYAFSNYLDCFLSQRSKQFHSIMPYIKAMVAMAIVLVILSQFNHMYYFIDEHNRYQRQSLFWLSQFWGIVGVFLNVFQLFRYRGGLRRNELIAFASYSILPTLAMVLQIKIYGIAFLYITTTFSILVIYLMIQVEQARMKKAQELELRENEITIMLSQIQPHFLFNCLTSISRLCDVDAKEAKKAVLSFAKYLRGNLNALTQKNLVPFEEEQKHVEIYLSLEKMRYKEYLKIEYDIQVRQFLIPPLTLQPMVENAVGHGLAKKEKGGTLRIFTREEAQCYLIGIEDDGVGFDQREDEFDHTHVGIKNVRGRIETISHGTLEIQSCLGKGTLVEIRIPKSIQ